MLTWPELETHVANGTLKRWTHDGKLPILGGRALYMTPAVFEAFQNAPWPESDGELPTRTQERRSAMRAVLKRFTLGQGMLIRRDIKELGSPLEGAPKVGMRGYWEFRSQGKIHETRLFGFFARHGAFVATDFKGRGEFRQGNQQDWDDQRKSCLARWEALTGSASFVQEPWPVLTRDQLTSYLSDDRN